MHSEGFRGHEAGRQLDAAVVKPDLSCHEAATLRSAVSIGQDPEHLPGFRTSGLPDFTEDHPGKRDAGAGDARRWPRCSKGWCLILWGLTIPGSRVTRGEEGRKVSLRPSTRAGISWNFPASLLRSSMNSTSDDLLRFLMAVERGGLFRSTTTWDRMQARWNRFPLPLDRASLRQPGWPIEYGLGVR